MGELKVRYSGAWRTITNPEVKYSGVWRALKTIEVKLGGVWREIFSALSATLNGTSGHHTRTWIGFCYAGILLDPDGNEYAMYASDSTNGDDLIPHWLITGTINDFWVRLTFNSGDALVGTSMTPGVWYAMSSLRWAYLSTGGPQSKTCNITLNIATDSGGSNIIETKVYVLNCTSFNI
ncbi:hypothetical protein LCGC14_0491440 [marine sediment metagenome]|uniref:Uncharacterized protein n=1 Tax=marine sediment metagenome TaxID=412755 RepID=A0A0F9UTE5_9ZZZZ